MTLRCALYTVLFSIELLLSRSFYFFLTISVEQIRVGPPQPKFTRSTKPKVFVTNGRDTPLRGIALVFTKVEPGAQITEQNISKVKSCDHCRIL